MEIKKLLVTTDLSKLSTEVFDLAAYEAKMKGAEINLIHVLGPPTQYYPGELEMGYESLLSDYRGQERDAVEEKMKNLIKDKFHSVKVKTTILEYQGSEGNLIAKYAKANNYDAIMIASSGRGALGQVFIGSTVMRLLQSAECAVIVIPVHKS